MIALYGDGTKSKRDVEEASTISGSTWLIVYNMWRARTNVTQTNKRLYQEAGTDLETVLAKLKSLDEKVTALENELDKNQVPYTPGRYKIPDWKMD